MKKSSPLTDVWNVNLRIYKTTPSADKLGYDFQHSITGGRYTTIQKDALKKWFDAESVNKALDYFEATQLTYEEAIK